ncbi:hypothetical protein HGRIS_009992 [Hohenbuehelia grisea]|uniref:50S ribosomal protein L22, chloroplastic n=1 Tax=Hohenbuehelia grisea TaxID=104357 RepID=A0ABR3J3A8_9AGAR
MQTSLRGVERTSRRLTSQSFAGCSRVAQWEARRHVSFNPANWIRERLAPAPRKKETPQEVAAAKKQAAEDGQRNLFEAASKVAAKKAQKEAAAAVIEQGIIKTRKPKPTSHKYSTAHFSISHRKLNLLGRQISGKPIDYAILQMQFSEKRASTRIRSMLVTAKEHAVRYKGLQESKLVVAESWVTKGPSTMKKMEPRGRAHYGIRVHPDSRMHVVLKEGKTIAEKKAEERARRLKKIVSASLVREDIPIRNPAPMWGW